MGIKLRRLIALLGAIVMFLTCVPIDGLFIDKAEAASNTQLDEIIYLNDELNDGITNKRQTEWFTDGDAKLRDYAPYFSMDYTAMDLSQNVGRTGSFEVYPAYYQDTDKGIVRVGGRNSKQDFIYYVIVVYSNTGGRGKASYAIPVYEKDLNKLNNSNILGFTELYFDSNDKTNGIKNISINNVNVEYGSAFNEFVESVMRGDSNDVFVDGMSSQRAKYIDSLAVLYKGRGNSRTLFSCEISTEKTEGFEPLFTDSVGNELIPMGGSAKSISRYKMKVVGKDGKETGEEKDVVTMLSGSKTYYVPTDQLYYKIILFDRFMKDNQLLLENIFSIENGYIRGMALDGIKNCILQKKDEMLSASEEGGIHATSKDLEEARKRDDGKTSVNEWFFKINYFFTNGVDATESVDDGGLGADGFKITDYGRAWVSDPAISDALTNNNIPSQDQQYETENLDYDYDEYSGGTWKSEYNAEHVSLEEDLRIRTYFNILAQYMYFEGDQYDNGPYEINGESYDSFQEYVKYLANINYGMRNTRCIGKLNGDDEKYALFNPNVIDVSGTGSKGSGISRQKAEAAAESKFRKVSDKPSYYSVAVNFDAIVDYFAYGVVSDERYTDKNGNTGDIKYNQNIENIVPEFATTMDSTLSDKEVNIGKAGLSFNGLGLPILKSLGIINRSMHSFEFYGKLNTSLMFIRQYAEIPKTKGELTGNASTAIDDGSEDTDENENEEPNESELENTEDENTGDADADTWYYDTGSKGTFSSSALLEIQDTSADARVVKDVEALGESELKEFIKCPKLESFINKNYGSEKTEGVNIPDDVAKLIAAYVHIHNGMDTLFGDKDSVMSNEWLSPEMKRIYLYYDEIKQWENEPSVESATNTTEPDEREAFRMFFQFEDVDQPLFTDDYITGVALSSTYVPLVTNLYDPESLSVLEDSQRWVDDFHYKYGFNRKALFIDTDEDAAVKAYITGAKSGLRVATLKDMLQPEKDIVLYVDTNMYNINKVAEMQQLAYSRIQNSEEAGTDSGGFFQSVGDGLANLMEIGAENIYKSGAVKLYSNKYASGSAAYGTDEGKSEKGMWFKSIWSPDNFILSTTKIEEYTLADEYQPMQGAAFTCGIYRDKNVYNICQNQSANPQPVFVSSSSLAGIKDQTKEQFNTIFNYLMLKNLSNNKQLDSEVDIDEDTPLFIDIYGNISTQSGLVVIPAACNASLYTAENFNVATAGFLSVYNKFDSVRLPERYGNADKYMGDYGFTIEESLEDGKNYWALGLLDINGKTIDIRGSGIASNSIRKALYSLAKQSFSDDQTASTRLFNQRVNMMLEVMRGAPIEHIDFEKEGLAGVRNLDKTAIYVTYRVEQLSDLFTSGSNGNSLVELPNIAYMSHIEYVVVFLFKALFSVGLFILMITIYVDGVAGVLGWKTIVKFILSILSVILGIIFVPSALNVSYYQTNKWLLQSEMTYMNMINTEKNALGKETGVVEVKKPESNTELFLKLDQVKIPWYVVAEDIFADNQFKRMSDVYNNAFQSSIYMAFDGVVQKGNGLYVSVDDLLDSSSIVFNNYDTGSADTKGYIFQVIEDNQEMSYILPYHFILDQLLYEIQMYNEPREGSSFVTKFKSNGSIMTYGLIEPYLLSNDFLGGSEDLLGLYSIYGVTPSSNTHVCVLDAVSDGSGSVVREQMQRTLWCQKDAYDEEELYKRLQELDYEARKFVINNRFLINKVSDETFVKCMALDLAIKHNDIFGVPAARSYEIMNVDTRDIMRMSLAPKSQVMKHASKSFANFVLSYGGFFAVCGVTMLIVMYWIVSLVKPLLMIVLLILLIVSYVYNKLIRRQNNKSFEGYIVSITLMCLVNILYAVSIKVSVWIPTLEVNALISILIQVVVQFLYVFVLLGIGYIVVKNAADVGFYTYKTIYDTHMASKIHSVQISTDRLISKITRSDSVAARRRAYNYNRNTRTSGLTGNDIMRQMQERDEELRNGRFRR